jgi:hypothetical protein
MDAGVRIYGIGAYRSAFALIMVWMLVSWFLIFFTRETYCRQQA